MTKTYTFLDGWNLDFNTILHTLMRFCQQQGTEFEIVIRLPFKMEIRDFIETLYNKEYTGYKPVSYATIENMPDTYLLKMKRIRLPGPWGYEEDTD